MTMISQMIIINSKYYGRKKHEKDKSNQGLIQALFDIGVPILGSLIWELPNLILSKTKTTIKHNSSFLIRSAT